MAFNLTPNQSEFITRSSGFDFNNGDLSKFTDHWNNLDSNKKTQLSNYIIGQGGSEGDIPGIINAISTRTPWGGANSTIGNPAATLAQDKAIVNMAGDPNNLNTGNTNLYNSMVKTGDISPFTAPAVNANPTAITAPSASATQPASTNLGFTGSSVPAGVSSSSQAYGSSAGNAPVDTSQWTQDDWQAVARMGGYTGPMGQGQHAAWLDADPTGQRRRDYQAASQAYASQYASGGGVVPVGVVEPLNDWQKTALTGIATGPSTTGYMDSAANSINNAFASVNNPGSVMESMNPFTDYMTGEVNRQYDAINNGVRARAARMGNSGSSAEALQQSENDKNRLAVIGNILAGNWNNAVSANQNKVNSNLGLSAAYQALDAATRNNYYDTLTRKLGAGGVAQGQNQKLLDAVQAEINRQQGYPYTQLDFLKSILGAYPTGSSTTTTTPGNMMGGLLGGALLGNYASDYLPLLTGGGYSPVAGTLNSNPNAALPWLS